jgi:hypothetical protein
VDPPAPPNGQKLEVLFEDLWAEVYLIETSVMLHSRSGPARRR